MGWQSLNPYWSSLMFVWEFDFLPGLNPDGMENLEPLTGSVMFKGNVVSTRLESRWDGKS